MPPEPPTGRADSSRLERYSINSNPPLKNPGYAPEFMNIHRRYLTACYILIIIE